MPDHAMPQDSGITEEHTRAVENIMKKKNAFLFVRPTEYDSTILIQEGFATKSMDIHDKSSNWGPMSGMVPCDPAFSKKLIGNPDPNPAYHDHGLAKPVVLELPWSLYRTFRTRPKGLDRVMGTYLLRANDQVVPRASNPRLTAQEGPLQMQRRFCRAKQVQQNNATSTLFCLKGGTGGPLKVFWVKWDGPLKQIGTLVPIWVWSYEVEGEKKPVTGDYDMWLVAPHASYWQQHAEAQALKDAHGTSTASDFTKNLIDEMNAACKKEAPRTNRVFNHGAEARNYAFTQALDPRLAMFTANGGSRMVEMSAMPQILKDLEVMGYLIIYNKRYGELDPRLSGKSTIKAIAEMDRIRKEADELQKEGDLGAAAEMRGQKVSGVIHDIAWKNITKNRFKRAMDELKQQKERGASPKALAQARWSLVRTAVRHGFESARITQFHHELSALLAGGGQHLVTLEKLDFPDRLYRYKQTARALQISLREAGVASTKGFGETDPEVFADWVKRKHTDLDQMYNDLVEIARTGQAAQ